MFEKNSAVSCSPGPLKAPKSFPAPYQMNIHARAIRTATRASAAGRPATRVLNTIVNNTRCLRHAGAVSGHLRSTPCLCRRCLETWSSSPRSGLSSVFPDSSAQHSDAQGTKRCDELSDQDC